jgi:hypothetical protein
MLYALLYNLPENSSIPTDQELLLTIDGVPVLLTEDTDEDIHPLMEEGLYKVINDCADLVMVVHVQALPNVLFKWDGTKKIRMTQVNPESDLLEINSLGMLTKCMKIDMGCLMEQVKNKKRA